MLHRIEIENFMSLRDVRCDLEPLTIFVGPNASGKSAVFKALVTLSKLLGGFPVRGPGGEFALEPGVTFDDVVWGGNSALPIKFRVWFDEDTDDNDPGYTLELAKRAEGWSVAHERFRAGDKWIEIDDTHPFEHPTERHGVRSLKPPLRGTLRYLVHPYINDSAAYPVIQPIIELAERFGKAWRYRPSASDIAAFVNRPAGPKARSFYVGDNGWGIAAELQALQGSKRVVFTAIENAVCKLFPHIKTIGFETDWQGVRLAFMTDRSEDPVPASQESDGVLLATFIFWRLYTAGPSIKVCLEEPESGLHPHLLGDRYQTLKNFAYPEGSQTAAQILVATHSRDFLRTVKTRPAALVNEIRVVDFDRTEGTSIKGLSHYRDAANLFEKYDNVGDLWLSGDVGGTPQNVEPTVSE